jgi:hypothetical protein
LHIFGYYLSCEKNYWKLIMEDELKRAKGDQEAKAKFRRNSLRLRKGCHPKVDDLRCPQG